MANPAGESNAEVLRLDFDRRLMLQFRGSVDAGLLAYRELDDALGLTTMVGDILADARTGKDGRHALVGMLRQSVFGRFAGYEDVNDAERLRHDPAMRWIVGGKAALGAAASPSQMGRRKDKNPVLRPIPNCKVLNRDGTRCWNWTTRGICPRHAHLQAARNYLPKSSVPGFYTAEAVALRRAAHALVRESMKLIADVRD
jgi:hypothetical protein